MTGRERAAVPVGVVVGLTWAAGLRAWTAQLVGEQPTMEWLTLVLVLLPGAVVGGLLGWAAVQRVDWVAPAPWRWSSGRVGALAVWTLGISALTLMGTSAAPLSTARGAWVCLLGGSLMGVLGLAAALASRQGPVLGARALPWVGAVGGLAWAATLRAFMAEVVRDGSDVSWLGTFGWVLLPGTLAGALLGWAESERRRGRPHGVLVWSPMLFVAVLIPGLADLGTLLEDGVGGGAVGVPLVLVAGAYAVTARRAWVRVACAAVFLAALAAWVLTATTVGGPDFALDNPYGIWAMVLYVGLLLTGALAASIPLRSPTPVGDQPAERIRSRGSSSGRSARFSGRAATRS